MSEKLLFSQLEKSNTQLKKECGTFGKKALKDAIAKSLANIETAKNSPNDADFDVISKPFFAVIEGGYKELVATSLNLVTNCFQYSTPAAHPSLESTKTIAKTAMSLTGQVKIITDQLKAKVGKLISSIIENQNVRCMIHGEFLGELFNFLIDLQVSTPGSSGEILSMTIQNLFRVYLDLVLETKDEPTTPEFKTVEEVAKNAIDTIISNILTGEKQKEAINDDAENDVITIVRVFSHAVESGRLNDATLQTCGEALSFLLESNNPILKRPSFEQLLQKDIHVALIGLSLDSHISLVALTGRLITVVWKRFPKLYLNGLNEVLDKGLATALASPYPKVVVRAIKLFNELAKSPQLLVDAFVNYDCDQSGFFRNIYKNIVERVVNCAKPGQQDLDMQPSALTALITTLDGLWSYFKEKSEVKQEETDFEEDAKNYLDAKKAKDVFDQGLKVFKNSEKKGLKFFQEHKLCGTTPQEIADFLFNTPSLDPASIGQILGGSKPENIAVLKIFINKFDFKGMSFEEGFRAFLSKFLIPGESQMIDRIMEQFGTKFYNDNQELFSCAETVYVLAFSALMLHTDAHHPTIKKHMTLPEFIANNKGIDQGHDLPDDFLTELYKGITSKKIFVSKNALPSSGLLTREQQADMYKEQCQQALQSARESTTDTKGLVFHRSESPLLIGPMFQTIWGPVLAALTMSFEATDEPKIIEKCLLGFQLSTHIASHCYVEEALQTLVDSFAKFTRLRTAKLSDVKPKNIECTNALIACAIEDHLYLKGAWSIVLGEISALDVMKDSDSFVLNMNRTDEIFALSAKLDRESILDFVGALCKIATAELEEDPPRLFSLLKLTDIAYFNMDRPMYLWKEIWGIIGRFLSYEGSSRNETVAQNTVDLLRQLARKFIPKQDKGSSISLQSHFLQPFNEIFSAQSNLSIKELILDCTLQLVQEHAAILLSGWDVVFQILTFSAMDEKLKMKGFNIVQEIINKHMTAVVPHAVHFVTVLMAFVTSDINAEISKRVISSYTIIADAIPSDQDSTWQCLLQSLGKCNQHPILAVKLASEEVLLSIIIQKGAVLKLFSKDIWEFIFSSPLRDLFELPEGESSEVYKHDADLLNNIVDNFIIKYFDAIKAYTSSIFKFMLFLSSTKNVMFLKTIIAALDRLVKATHEEFDEQMIEDLLKLVEDIQKNCLGVVTFATTISNIISLFEGNENVYTRIMAVLDNVSKVLEENNSESIYEPWCETRACYACRLIAHGEAEQAAEYIKYSLSLFTRIEAEKKTTEHWNNLIGKSLESIADSNDEVFNVCVESTMKDILTAIETESPVVRKEIMRIMKRKLSQ